MSEVLNKFIDRLTDGYNKSPDSGVYKLAQIATTIIQENEDTLNRIGAWRDVDQAEGVALDMLGANVRQNRGQAPDEVYRILIKSKIKRNLSNGSINTLIDFLSFILQVDKTDVNVRELWKNGMYLPATIANLVGKIKGSTVENPHIYKNAWEQTTTGLLLPNSTSFNEDVQGSIDAVTTLNGSTGSGRTTKNGAQGQQLFSFNVIAHTERKYGPIPAATTADKITWLKNNLSKLYLTWNGYGVGPAGNKATLRCYDNINAKYDPWSPSHTKSTIDKLTFGLYPSTGMTIDNGIDTNGFIHFMVYAEASNGTIASAIRTDYIELSVELKPEANILPANEREYGGLKIDVPMDAINATGLSRKQFGTLINLVTVAGVNAEVLFEGTFRFSNTYDASETSSNGFSDDTGTTGGTLGDAFDPAVDYELPF